MTRQSSFGDCLVTNIGRWTPSRVTLAMFHAYFSILAWKFCFQTPRIELCASGTCRDVCRFTRHVKTPTDTGSWLPTHILTTLLLVMIRAWMYSSWSVRDTHQSALDLHFSSSSRSSSTCMTWRQETSRLWPQSRQLANKSFSTSPPKSITMPSIRAVTISFSILMLRVDSSFCCHLIKIWDRRVAP